MRKFAFSMCVVLVVFASGFCDDKFDALLAKAKAGNASAQAEVGRSYAIGTNGVQRDFQNAVMWLSKSAEQGNADGEYMLGVMYAFGRGVPNDFPSTLKWFDLAAKQGKVEAQFQLGKIYDLGQPGTARDPALAAKYYREAAAQGQPAAKLRLAQMYEAGEGVPQDYPASLKLYQELGRLSAGTPAVISAQALYKIGYFYERGYSLPKDRQKALEWYHKAADHGSVEAVGALKRMQQ